MSTPPMSSMRPEVESPSHNSHQHHLHLPSPAHCTHIHAPIPLNPHLTPSGSTKRLSLPPSLPYFPFPPHPHPSRHQGIMPSPLHSSACLTDDSYTDSSNPSSRGSFDPDPRSFPLDPRLKGDNYESHTHKGYEHDSIGRESLDHGAAFPLEAGYALGALNSDSLLAPSPFAGLGLPINTARRASGSLSKSGSGGGSVDGEIA
ncbi:hypothetical protein B0H19DRAFT_1264515 [Mycena capillaripes]|nr:hypothetical protein B0H19DRAFT_1264515 [Mycena capillaripes]